MVSASPVVRKRRNRELLIDFILLAAYRLSANFSRHLNRRARLAVLPRGHLDRAVSGLLIARSRSTGVLSRAPRSQSRPEGGVRKGYARASHAAPRIGRDEVVQYRSEKGNALNTSNSQASVHESILRGSALRENETRQYCRVAAIDRRINGAPETRHEVGDRHVAAEDGRPAARKRPCEVGFRQQRRSPPPSREAVT